MPDIDVSNVISYEEVTEEVSPGVFELVRRVTGVGPAVKEVNIGDEEWRIPVDPPQTPIEQQLIELQAKHDKLIEILGEKEISGEKILNPKDVGDIGDAAAVAITAEAIIKP